MNTPKDTGKRHLVFDGGHWKDFVVLDPDETTDGKKLIEVFIFGEKYKTTVTVYFSEDELREMLRDLTKADEKPFSVVEGEGQQ